MRPCSRALSTCDRAPSSRPPLRPFLQMTRSFNGQPVTCFVHIPKTAGSTVADILRSVYGRSAVLDLPPQLSGGVEDVVANLPLTIRAVTGHVRYGLHAFN